MAIDKTVALCNFIMGKSNLYYKAIIIIIAVMVMH